jgi:hypothetical protein
MTTIHYATGSTTTHPTHAAALEALRAQYPGLVTGDADADGRVLVWADVASAENDPGVRAVAEIRDAAAE